MLNLQKNERNDVYFWGLLDVRKLTFLTANFHMEAKEPLREIAWWSYGI